jgi:hypothetical protein
MVSSNEQLEKTPMPRLVRPAGSSMASRNSHSKKANSPMLVRVSGSLMVFSDAFRE